MYRYSDVFVPGGFPSHTYNPRVSLNLEATLREVEENLCKLVTVTGHTKSGKTVLTRKVLPKDKSVWVDGGTVREEDDFWQSVVSQLNLFQEHSEDSKQDFGGEIGAKGSAGAGVVIATGNVEASSTIKANTSAGSSAKQTVSSRVAAINGLRAKGIPLIIDDFHYLDKDVQGEIVRALKPLVFDGLAVVVIAIPHRRYDAMKVEKEMTSRILRIEIPVWSSEELRFIADTGFGLLNVQPDQELIHELISQAIGSPHLMQEFCREICKANGITRTVETGTLNLPFSLSVPKSEIEKILRQVADAIGRPIFEKLARGPRQRSDRMERVLKGGQTVDIYGLVLHALAELKPGLVTLEYEQLRSAIKDVSATTSSVPQLHEVVRVLKKMAEIAATDESSTPVIDFEEEDGKLHITDPFFAFYLRWGNLN